MLNLVCIGCELLYAAAQAWLVLQLVNGLFRPALTVNLHASRPHHHAGKSGGLLCACSLTHWDAHKPAGEAVWHAVLIALMAALRLGNATGKGALLSNAVLIIGILILTAGSALLFLCSIPDALFVSALGMTGLALGDLTAQALIGLILDSFRLENGISAPGIWRGMYFLIWAAAMLPAGRVLRRWAAGKRLILLAYRKTLPVLLIPILFSIVCFQQFPGKVLGSWAVFLLCCALLFLALWLSMVKHGAENESQMLQLKMSMLESGYQELSEVYRERAILVHDAKNHLRAISAMLDQDKQEEAMAYISRITEEPERGNLTAWCNHEMMNLVLNTKFREARKARIQVECHCDDMSGLALTSTEICALFSNILDNAIEANRKCAAERERRIKLLCARRERMLMISLSNPVEKAAADRKCQLFETTKRDRKLHGLGMQSVKKIVDSYHGDIDAKLQGNEFSMVICLAVFGEAAAIYTCKPI